MASDTRSSSKEFEDTKAPIGGDPAVVPITEDDLYIDPAREARLVRKLDMRIAPVVSGEYGPAVDMLTLVSDGWYLPACLPRYVFENVMNRMLIIRSIQHRQRGQRRSCKGHWTHWSVTRSAILDEADIFHRQSAQCCYHSVLLDICRGRNPGNCATKEIPSQCLHFNPHDFMGSRHDFWWLRGESKSFVFPNYADPSRTVMLL
jgi:hypothetical protein